MNMAKKNNAVYAPGELGRVREKLGVTDAEEAKRMAQILGGEVGTERNTETANRKKNTMVGDKKRIRRIDVASNDDSTGSWFKSKRQNTGDDPSIPVKLSYSERVKLDQYAGQLIFEIKNSLQVIISILSFFREPVDYLNSRFVTIRLNEYYNKIDKLVSAARNIFPKNNSKRNHQLKRASPFVFKIINTIRNWDIETLSKNIAELQAHPRAVKATDCTDVLRGILRPLFILDGLNVENIKSAFKLVYKVLYIESPMEAKEKYQDIIRNIIASLMDIRKNVQFGVYPLVMKLISDRFFPFETFFNERRKRYMAFLNITEAEQITPGDLTPQQIENIDVETLQKTLKEEEENPEITEEDETEEGEGEEGEKEEDSDDPKTNEHKAKEEAERSQAKAVEQGRTAMAALFPKAGWDKLEEFPDLYPYFANMYILKNGYELIAPTDAVQQVAILLHILDDLFIGLRYVDFGFIAGSDGKSVRVGDELDVLLNQWRGYIEDSFSRDYLPRLNEYCRMLENSRDSRTPYAKKNLNELHWIKRLYFLPFYRFESIGPPPFPKKDIIPIYSEVRKLRKTLTSVALGIEQGIRSGGAAAKVACNGINNPWEHYNFQVPNPVSRRMDMMLPSEKKINATIVFFSLSAVTLLDHIINEESSWAYSYGGRPGPLFRSINDDGITPQFGVDQKLDADQIFKESLKKGNV